MKRFLAQVGCLVVGVCSCGAVSAFEGANYFPPGSELQRCYGNAMVGMDSVINSRIGVPAEHALDLARLSKMAATGENRYSTYLLDTILNAYLWEGSPHSYAITVFYACAQRSSPGRLVSVPATILNSK